jgi:3-oxoacyl-[acyl-carrier-protein] synthase-3
MAFLKFNSVGISGMAACVPVHEIDNYNYSTFFPESDVRSVIEKIGVYKRRFADPDTCASDLCAAAAERLLNDMQVDKGEVDLLLFVSQTPDYRMPATSAILQQRLGLPRSIIAMDINIGCAGFIYSLTVAYSFLAQENIRKVLILNGETRSRVYSAKDRKTAFLFGDAAAAVLVEKGVDYQESFFSLNTDGAYESLIKINAGGYRNPSGSETVKERVADKHGNIRSDEHGYMNGESVFNFVATEVPKDLKRIFDFAGMKKEQIDYFVFHQANQFMNQYLVKKLRLDPEKIPASIAKYGNTSSVSIPLTIVSELKDKLATGTTLCLIGFGTGMTWGSAIIPMSSCHLSSIVEY